MSADTDSAMLARLVEQGRSEGADFLTLRAVAEEASELGAARALERLGLADPRARSDLDELRELRLKNNVLAGTLDDYQLSFESGETMQGRFLLTKLDYSGDFNGERAYTLALESSGQVVSL